MNRRKNIGQPCFGSHPYLNEFILEHKCRRLMEIGVYNGDSAVSMVETATRNHKPSEVEYYGFDFFTQFSSSQVGQMLEETGCMYRLFEGNTMDTLLEAVKTLPAMDLIFIDGGKSYEEASSDWRHASQLMHGSTGVFVHNADFYGIRRMVYDISRIDYIVQMIHPPLEGSVARITRAAKE